MIATALRTLGFALLVAVQGCATSDRSIQAASPALAQHGADPQPVATPSVDDTGSMRSRTGKLPDATGLAAASPEVLTQGPVTVRARLSRAGTDNSPSKRILLRLDYGAAAEVPAERPHLNVALVIDRSNSMAESRKLQYALAAARWVVDNMADGDTLSIVAFGDQATVLSPAGRVVNKPFVFHRLDEIAPSGYTNLSAGLLEGIAQVMAGDSNEVKQVLLLTDGLANRGETDPTVLRRIAERARARGIGVSTMGVGTEFSESLLADIATAGGGRYTYVNTPEQIPAAFKGELHGLLQLAAQNMTIEISVTGGVIAKVYGKLLDRSMRGYKVEVGDLRATESGLLIVELENEALKSEETMQIELRLTFDAPREDGRVHRSVRVRPPLDGVLDEDPGVTLAAAILDALERADAALRGLDAERHGQVRVLFERVHERAREHAISTRDQQLLNQAFVLKHFVAELAEVERAGLFHGHRDTREKLAKESHYLRYLLTHHRAQP